MEKHHEKYTGRPTVKDKRIHVVRAKLNNEEKEQFDKLLNSSVYNYHSELIRDVVLNKHYKIVTVDEKLQQEKAILITQIKKIGGNFNRLITLLNTKKINYFTEKDIELMKKNLIEIRNFFNANKDIL